jgi:hypothetical protein
MPVVPSLAEEKAMLKIDEREAFRTVKFDLWKL